MKSEPTYPKLINIASWAVAIIIIILPFHAFLTSWGANNFGYLDVFRVWKEILILLILPIVIYLGWKNQETRSFIKESWVVKLFILYIFLHLVLGLLAIKTQAVNREALLYSFIINLRFIGFFLITYIVAAQSAFLKKNVYKIVLWPAIGVIAVGLIQRLTLSHNLLGYFYGRATIPPYQTIDGNEDLKRIQSTLRGANPLGAYLILSLVAIAAFIKRRALRYLLLLMGFFVLFYSFSRSGWIGSLIGLWLLSWWMLLKKHHRTWVISSVMILFVIIGSTFYLFKSQPLAKDALLHTSDASRSSVSSNEARRESLKNGFYDVTHQPFGGGPGTAGPASYRNNPLPTRISENYFLQIGQEVGVVGLLTFIAINGVVARNLWVKRQELLARVLLASLAGITFVNLISHAWTDDTLSLIWWGLAGICLAPVYKSRLKSRPKPIKH